MVGDIGMQDYKNAYINYMVEVSYMETLFNILYDVMYNQLINSEEYNRALMLGLVKDEIKVLDFTAYKSLVELGIYLIKFNEKSSKVVCYFYPRLLTYEYQEVKSVVKKIIEGYNKQSIFHFNLCKTQVEYNLLEINEPFDYILWTIFGRHWVDRTFEFKNIPEIVYLTDRISTQHYMSLYNLLGTKMVKVLNPSREYELYGDLSNKIYWQCNIQFYIHCTYDFDSWVRKLVDLLRSYQLKLDNYGVVQIYVDKFYNVKYTDNKFVDELNKTFHVELHEFKEIGV